MRTFGVITPLQHSALQRPAAQRTATQRRWGAAATATALACAGLYVVHLETVAGLYVVHLETVAGLYECSRVVDCRFAGVRTFGGSLRVLRDTLRVPTVPTWYPEGP